MLVDYVPVAELSTRAEMIARQKEIRRRQEEAARKLEALRPKPVHIEIEASAVEVSPAVPVAPPVPPTVIPSAALARLPKAIIRRVAAQYGVTYDDIVRDDRTALFVTARYAAIKAVREAHPNLSIKHLGRIFGGRDQSSIRNALGLNRRQRGINRQKSGLVCADARSPKQIIEDIARKHSVLPHDVIGRCYNEAVSLARYEAVVNIRAAHPELTARQIGELFDGRSEFFAFSCSVYMRRLAA
jgi:hypothetical protein